MQELIPMRLDGMEIHDLREYATANRWNVSYSQLRRYLRRADLELAKAREKRTQLLLGRDLAVCSRRMHACIEVGNEAGAATWFQLRARLAGLFDDGKKAKPHAPADPASTSPTAPEPTLADYRAALVALLGATGPETPDVRPDHTAE